MAAVAGSSKWQQQLASRIGVDWTVAVGAACFVRTHKCTAKCPVVVVACCVPVIDATVAVAAAPAPAAAAPAAIPAPAVAAAPAAAAVLTGTRPVRRSALRTACHGGPAPDLREARGTKEMKGM